MYSMLCIAAIAASFIFLGVARSAKSLLAHAGAGYVMCALWSSGAYFWILALGWLKHHDARVLMLVWATAAVVFSIGWIALQCVKDLFRKGSD